MARICEWWSRLKQAAPAEISSNLEYIRINRRSILLAGSLLAVLFAVPSWLRFFALWLAQTDLPPCPPGYGLVGFFGFLAYCVWCIDHLSRVEAQKTADQRRTPQT